MQSLDAFILIGGQSRRMGREKSGLTIDGQTFVELIANQLSTVATSITVVGDSASQPKLPQVRDVYPGWGALGGVHTALANCSSEWALVVACDFPFVTAELFLRMQTLIDDFEAVAPIQLDQVPQPLCALYRVEPCMAQAEVLIKSGERKPIALLQSVRTRWIAFDELADVSGSEHFFDNINTPEDYARIAKRRNDSTDAVAL